MLLALFKLTVFLKSEGHYFICFVSQRHKSSVWDSPVADNLIKALLIDCSREIWLKGSKTSVVYSEALRKKLKSVSGRKRNS